MENFVCLNCRYKFKSSKGGRCPYCDKNTVQKEPSANDLIEDLDSLSEE